MEISFLLPVLVILVGIFLLFKLGFFFIFHPIRTIKEFSAGLKDRESRRAFFLALAGTLGVGNIFGVAAGLMIGGEGSIFWLFISSIFSVIIKYAEVLLVIDGQRNMPKSSSGGMAGLISGAMKNGRVFSIFYAGLTVALSLTMGGAMQTSAICDIGYESLGLMPIISIFILIILLLPALIGGTKKIESITEVVIPLTTIIYIIMCLSAIFINFDRLYEVIMRVITSSFLPESLIGGVTAIAIKEGFARGILSNEAGAGTSALAHSRAGDRSPHLAGLFGMCEVVFDTTILCTLTGLSILISVDDLSVYRSPMSLVFDAFRQTLGDFSLLLFPLVIAFAYSTIICWFFYGAECCNSDFGKFKRFFPFAFLGFVAFSFLFPAEPLLYVTDFLLLLMAALTLFVVVKKVNRIVFLSKNKGLP